MKREQQTLQSLGVELASLQDEQLQELDLEERLLDALHELKRMKSREAARRHRQYIGKLMRDVDPAPIQALLDRLRADDRRQKRVFANAERWRDRLASERQGALPAFEAETGAAAPELAQLINDLNHAVSDNVERRVRRQIFRAIHDVLAYLAWWADARGLAFTHEGRRVKVNEYEGLHGDYIGRLSDWPWPSTGNEARDR